MASFLFLGSRSWYTWTPWNWNVDVIIPRMIREEKMRSAIVVAPWMLPKDNRRRNEYMPQKPITREVGRLLEADKSDIQYERLNSDNYLKFLVEELKPFIDKTYKTNPEKDNTFIMGSSMGGMISAYAISEYPDVFGGAACMSTHWSDANGAVVQWYQNNWPEAGSNRLYFDYGTESYDAAYEPYQQLMDETMRSKGYTEGRDWVTRKFHGASHRPSAWRDRLHIPLEFLLGTDR
jgi:predicted alpha/beta superfamily hydrolase